MAIIVEQDKKKINWFGLLIAVVLVVIVFSGGYFFFFKKPELIDVVAPKNLQDLNNISKVSFDPESVIDSPAFKVLRRYGTSVPLTETPGKSNPFRQ